MDASNQIPEETQKIIRKITRLAAIGFLVIGLLVLVTGGGIILGSVLVLIGLTDIVLVPHFLEKMITAKFIQRNNKG